MKTKICKLCNNKLKISLFRKRIEMKDGYRNECNPCFIKRKLILYEKNKKHFLDYAFNYRKTKRGKEVAIKKSKKWQKKNWKKTNAHVAVRYAIITGKIKRPLYCQSCKQKRCHQAHHDDYNLKLKVRWLCYFCHKIWHKNNGEGLNAR